VWIFGSLVNIAYICNMKKITLKTELVNAEKIKSKAIKIQKIVDSLKKELNELSKMEVTLQRR